MYRLLLKHKLISMIAIALVLCAAISPFLWNIEAGVWLHAIFYMFFAVLAVCFVESASDKLLKAAAKALHDNCDPTVLLRETEQQLEYEKRGITNQLVLLNHTVALGYMGEYSKAFEILSSFDADKYKFISPYRAYIKMIHSNNMADTCDELGDFESASAWHKKTLDAAKKLGMLKSSEIILAKASEALRKKDYGAVLKALEGFKEKNMLEKICASMVYAKAYIGLGEIEKAKEKLSFIIENGNKLYTVEQAKKMLEGI